MLNQMRPAALYGRLAAASSATRITSPRGLRLNHHLWLLLVLTNIIDVIGTGRAFQLGIGELNPIVAAVHGGFGMPGLISLKGLFLGALLYLLPFVRSWTRILFILVCSAYLSLTFAHIWYLLPLL